MIADIYEDTKVSDYTPSEDVKQFTHSVQKDYGYGNEILHRGWEELNGYSVIDRMNKDQRTFNAFVDETVENPADAWKWRGTRSKARNKAVAMHAQLTAGYIFPSFLAQNESDEEDIIFSEMMDDSVEWLGNNSNYKPSFLLASMGMLVNPITYMGAEWFDVYQTIKEKTEDGYTKREIRDEVLSGFSAPIYSADQILISNAYEQNIQRHRFNITRRFIEWTEAKAKYQNHENWEYVHPGIKTIYNESDGLFYDVKDDDHPHLVEEVTYKNRRDDTEVCFLNGIYMGNMNDVELNPIRHRDNRGAPKYNVVGFGYQRINEHFFYYKSLMNAMHWDNMLLDAQYELGMNRGFLESNMPMGFSGVGDDKIDSDVIFPSAVVAFKSADAKGFPLLQSGGVAPLFQALRITEESMDEASVSDTSAGQLPATSTKATAIAIANQNAKTMLMGVGKTLAQSVVDYGDLMKDIVINHLSTAEVDEIAGDTTRLKYRTLLLKKKVVNGKEIDKVIRFDESLLGREMSEDQKKYENLKLLKEAGYPNDKKAIYRINPLKFSMSKYLTRCEPESMFPKNEEWMQAIYSQVYTQFSQNPYIELEALTRKTLYAYFKGETEDLMKKAGETDMGNVLGASATQFGQQAQNTSTAKSTALAGAGLTG